MSLAAELIEKVPGAEIEIVAGQEKSEFAVFIDGERIFSRLERRRFPELEDLLAT